MELKQMLEQQGITFYERKGILTGVWNKKGTRKYRLKNLGFDIHNLERKKEIKQQHKRDIDRRRER
jgi:hypothetical protein